MRGFRVSLAGCRAQVGTLSKHEHVTGWYDKRERSAAQIAGKKEVAFGPRCLLVKRNLRVGLLAYGRCCSRKVSVFFHCAVENCNVWAWCPHFSKPYDARFGRLFLVLVWTRGFSLLL